jgi:hypothetical protein
MQGSVSRKIGGKVQVQRFDWRTVSCDDVGIGGVQPLMHGFGAHVSETIFFEKLGRCSEVTCTRTWILGMLYALARQHRVERNMVAGIVDTVLEL